MSSLFSWDRFVYAFPRILTELPTTLKMILYAEFFGIILGVLIAVIRIYKIPVINQVYSVYISFMRGTPILVQLLVVFYGVPTVLLNLFNIDVNGWDKFVFATIALTLNESTMLSEIFRSAIGAIPHTQFEAGYSVGLTNFQTLTRIIIPQVIPIAVPILISNVTAVMKTSAIAFSLGIFEVYNGSIYPCNVTYSFLEGYVASALIYWAMAIIIENLGRLIEKNSAKYRKFA